MALEYSIQQQQQNPLLIKSFKCAYCNQSRYKSGFFLILKNVGMQVFCSKKCADYGKKNKRRIACKVCGKSFINLTSAKNRKYCSRPCGRKDQPDRYKIFNWCDLCNEWIRKKDSIFKPIGTITNTGYKTKQDSYFCHICNNRLRLESKYYKKKNDNTTTTIQIRT